MATKIIIKSYNTGEVVKTIELNAKAQGKSIEFQPEYVGGNKRFVIRDRNTGEKLQTVACPAGSIEYYAR